MRRLATTSNTDLNPHFLTKWNLYWQELGKWKLYKEVKEAKTAAEFLTDLQSCVSDQICNVESIVIFQRDVTTVNPPTAMLFT